MESLMKAQIKELTVNAPQSTNFLFEPNFRMLRTVNTEAIKHEYGNGILGEACGGGRAGRDSCQ